MKTLAIKRRQRDATREEKKKYEGVPKKRERLTIRPDLKSETGIINEKVALMMLHLRFSLIQRHAADGMR